MQAHKCYENCFRCGRKVMNSFLLCDENIVMKKQHVMKIVMNTVMKMMNKVIKIIKMVIFVLDSKRRNDFIIRGDIKALPQQRTTA